MKAGGNDDRLRLRRRMRRDVIGRVLVVLAGIALPCASCGTEQGASSSSSSSSGEGGAQAGTGSGGTGDGGGAMLGQCGPGEHGYAWGESWPGPDARKKMPKVLEPAFAAPSCGPGCRMVTTRLNYYNGRPRELHFRGNRFMAQTATYDANVANYVDLDSGAEYGAAPVPPEEGANTDVQTLVGDDCIAKTFTYYGTAARRSYACELCAHTAGQRLLGYAEGAADDASVKVGVVESDDRYVILARNNSMWALDTRDGSTHTLVNSLYYVTNVSLFQPYIVLPEADAEVHVIRTDDWSDENITHDPALQYMAASDGKRVVWVDFRYFPPPSPPTAEIVAYDLATKTTTRITHSEQKPSNKFYPTVEGDWVVWNDDRDSDVPNGPIEAPRDRLDMYGYDFKTGKEYHLVGNNPGDITFFYPILPRLHRGKLYVVGHPDLKHPSQLFEFELPSP